MNANTNTADTTRNLNDVTLEILRSMREAHEKHLAGRARRREFRREAAAKAADQGLHGAARTARARKLYRESLAVYRAFVAA